MTTITASPVLVEEARRSLPQLREEAMAPAGLAGVKQIMGKRFAIWRPRERPEGEWAAFWSDYETVLGHLTTSALEAGMKAWMAGGATRLPYPGELLSLARGADTPEALAYARARRALADTQPEQPKRENVPKEQLAAELASFRKEMDHGRERRLAANPALRPKPLGPPLSAPVGETGVSAELLHQIYGGDDAASIQAQG